MSDQEKLELSRKLIFEALKKYRGLFNKSPEESDLETYAEMLVGEFEFKQVTWALSQHVKKGSAFFPSCGEIFNYLTPRQEAVQDKAPQIAQEILQLLRWYGPHAEDEMFKEASSDARRVFQAIGYTGDIRNSENYETTKAQIERLARGVLASQAASEKNEQLQKMGIDTSKVLTMKKPEMKSLSFTDFTPGPA